MTNCPTHPRRVAVWVAMAEHFLDTETRQDIALTALCCVEAGLTPNQASDVWRYEVSPAVSFNLWDVAGEWAGWDRDWLVQRIERLRTNWHNRAGTCGALRYRLRVHCMHGVWMAIGRCMEALVSVPTGDGRRQLARDLTFLARHYFDFGPGDLAALDSGEQQRIRALYPEPFQRIMAPALVPGEAKAADGRARSALHLEGLR